MMTDHTKIEDHIATLRHLKCSLRVGSLVESVDAAIAALEREQANEQREGCYTQAEPVGEVLRIDEGTARVALFNDAVAVGSPLYAAPQQAGVREDDLIAEVQAYREMHNRLDALLGDRLILKEDGDYRAAIENTITSLQIAAAPPPPAGDSSGAGFDSAIDAAIAEGEG